MREIELIRSEQQQVQAAMIDYDTKFHLLGTEFVAAIDTIDQRTAEILAANTQLEAQISLVSGKCSQGEALLKELRPRLDAYKAKFVR